MSMYEPGTRVFAALSATQEEIKFLGFGTYVGDEPRGPENFPEEDYEMAEEAIQKNDDDPLVTPEAVRQYNLNRGATEEEAEEKVAQFEKHQEEELARPLRERAHEILCTMNLNPKIELDNGDIVWGYQCWWGPIERWDEFSQGRKVIDTTIEEALGG